MPDTVSFVDLPVVFDFDEIPVDDDHVDSEPDADNSVLGAYPDHALPEPKHDRMLTASKPTRPAKAKVLGPLRRELRMKKVPMRGKDVRAVNRGMARAGIIKWQRGGLFPLVAGIFFFRNIRKFQKKMGLHVDGVYGNATHRAMGKFMDQFAIKLYQDAKIGLSGPELKRQRFRSHALYLYHMRDRIHYTMGGSRMTIVRRKLMPENLFRFGDIWEDCSSIGKGMFKWITIPDPNGYGYDNAWGYTGTMTRTGRSIPAVLNSMKIGDAMLTGSFPYTHVWYYIGSGYGISHGKESDPRIVLWNYRPVAHVQRYIPDA
jgi:hypothetical protein